MEVPNISSKNKWILGIVSAVSVYFIIKYLNKTMEENLQDVTEDENDNVKKYDLSPVWDATSEKLINKLHPKVRDKIRAFINEAEKQGIKLKVTSTLRTYAEQDKLYAQGRTTKGGKVTNARGGYSWHNFAVATDVVPIENGKVNYNSKNWSKIGSLGKTFGLEWGGDWKSFVDKPHFQDNFGLSLAQARLKIKNNNLDNQGYLLA
jgi:peptidoglycan L-alanyl-D-glutamate endopeptidase CwlK